MGVSSRMLRVAAALAIALGNLFLSAAVGHAAGSYSGSFSVHFPDRADPADPNGCPLLADVVDVSGRLSFTIGDQAPGGASVTGTLSASGSSDRHYKCEKYFDEWDQSATVSVSGGFSAVYVAASNELRFNTDADANGDPLRWAYHVNRSNCVRFQSDTDLAPCKAPSDFTDNTRLVFVGSVTPL